MSATALFIGVTYGTDELAVKFARSVIALQPAVRVVLLLLDNTERTGREALETALRTLPGEVLYLRAPGNLGYFGGAAHALQWYRTSYGLPEWVIVSNVDVEFRATDFLHSLCRTGSGPGVGVLAPSIWSGHLLQDLNPQLIRRPRSSTMRFYRLVFRHVLLLNLYELLSLMKYQVKLVMRKLRALARGPHAIQNGRYRRSIYAAQGACLIFTREYFERGGSLRYGSFLFYEEIFVAETAREIGVDIVYEPTLRVWHDDHASTGFPRSRKMTKYFGDSAKYVADRYFS